MSYAWSLKRVDVLLRLLSHTHACNVVVGNHAIQILEVVMKGLKGVWCSQFMKLLLSKYWNEEVFAVQTSYEV